MDTITTGIGGALLAKAFFTDHFAPEPGHSKNPALREGAAPVTLAAVTADTAAPKTANLHARWHAGRSALWVFVLGSVFPDVDVFFDTFQSSPVASLVLHRGVTHSLVGLPGWALLLAALTWWGSRRLRVAAPSFRALFGLYAVALAFHIWTDLITSFGTMIWSPVAWTRVAWDLVFIIDFVFTAILLGPQLAAWAHQRREGAVRRAVFVWLLLSSGAVGVWWLAQTVGRPISISAVAVAGALFFLLCIAPLWRGLGQRWSRAQWCRAGVAALALYVGGCAMAHRLALAEVRRFAAEQNLTVINLAALPAPPSLLNWTALVQTPEGVFRATFRLPHRGHLQPRFFPQTVPAELAARVRQLPEVQTFLWFARFPVLRHHEARGRHVVDLADLRFGLGDNDNPSAFTYRVVLDAQGNVLSSDWLED
ncbi:MAG: metal-dependent hydrolase [Firmicutes bacterium]|nr:metal-dependent hydrolase [Bacillota bacterium]